MNIDKLLAAIFGENNSKFPKSKRIQFRKRTNWIISHVVSETQISGTPTFYIDANESGNMHYKSVYLSKVNHSTYDSVQKSNLYAILMILFDFPEHFNIVPNSQYAGKVVLHIETLEFFPDDTELTLLLIQL